MYQNYKNLIDESKQASGRHALLAISFAWISNPFQHDILAAITFGAVMSIAKILAVLIMFYFSCVEALPVSMKRQ